MTDLDWPRSRNVRDLVGLPLAGGACVAPGALVRADDLDRLTPDGRAALIAHGVRTVIDLRNDEEREGAPDPPAGVTRVHVPLDGMEDREFWDVWQSGPQFATPLYYRPHLERFPERHAAVVRAVAAAPPGGVAVHCVSGRDRTGLAIALLLLLAGGEPAAVAADYAHSAERLDPEEGEQLAAFLADAGHTPESALRAAFDGLDVDDYVAAAGVTSGEIAAVRRRLIARG